MNVTFTNTTSAKLSSLAITNGQLIALSDKPAICYDLGGVRKQLTLSDNYTSSAGTASAGVGASSYALSKLYDTFKHLLTVNATTIKLLSSSGTETSDYWGYAFEFFEKIGWFTITAPAVRTLTQGWNKVGQLKDGYKPNREACVCATSYQTNVTTQLGGYVNKSGEIMIFNPSTTNITYWRAFSMYDIY